MTNLSFKSLLGKYVATFTTTGDPMVLQLQLAKEGDVNIYASIGTLPKVLVGSLSSPTATMKTSGKIVVPKNVIRVINMPANVKVTVMSNVSVTGGYE